MTACRFKPQLDSLPPAQRLLWPELRHAPRLGFALKALVYFDDGDLQELKPAEKSTLIEAVKSVRDLPEVALRSTRLCA